MSTVRQVIAVVWVAFVCQAWLATASKADAPPAATPSPVMQHYRSYRAAIEQGNLALAEMEAASALAASSELNADGAPTAALAVNLASLRLIRKEHVAAVEPARQALAIAEAQGDASGVDVHAVRLLLGRAELPGGDAAAMERLLQAVREAQGEPGLEAEAYPAAVELATAAHDAGRFALATEAWVASARSAKGSPVNADYARARAKLGEATARIVPIAKAPAGAYRAPISEFDAINDLLLDATALLHDQALHGVAGGELTPAQAVYGQAVVLSGALEAKLRSENRGLARAAAAEPSYEIVRAADAPPVCEWTYVNRPKPVFPPERLVANGVGAVLLKIQFDDTGAVKRAQVAGSVGGAAFTDAVLAAVTQWRVQKTDDAVPGCTLAREIFKGFTFAYSNPE